MLRKNSLTGRCPAEGRRRSSLESRVSDLDLLRKPLAKAACIAAGPAALMPDGKTAINGLAAAVRVVEASLVPKKFLRNLYGPFDITEYRKYRIYDHDL